MGFRLILKSVTLNDLKRRVMTADMRRQTAPSSDLHISYASSAILPSASSAVQPSTPEGIPCGTPRKT